MSTQIGLFVRLTPGDRWTFRGWYDDPQKLKDIFMVIEFEHPQAEGVFMDPEKFWRGQTA